MRRDDPAVVAEISALFFGYEEALVTGDLDAMAGYFDDSDRVIRYGVADRQRGSAQLAAFRAAQGALPPGRTLSDTEIATFGSDIGIVATLFRYPDRGLVGRQSQTWVRFPHGWRIVHAHVSEVVPDLEGER